MIKKILTGKIPSIVAFCALSFLAGGVNGFVGTGGGIIFIYMLSLLTENNKKDNFALTLCATVPISAIALISYAKEGLVDLAHIKETWVFCATGGILGAFLVDKLHLPLLKVIFAVLVIYSGARMILG